MKPLYSKLEIVGIVAEVVAVLLGAYIAYHFIAKYW